MEPILLVKVSAPVASFRRPLDHNYQRTLPMPPPTTILGIAGAALGLADRDLWKQDSLLRNLKVSVWIEKEPGRARDMWTVLKIKGGKIAERSPYFRELLFEVQYTLLYGGEKHLLQNLAMAFQDPRYPLSLGREDELLHVQALQLAECEKGRPIFEGTIIPKDIRNVSELRPILRPGGRFEPPLIERLPLAFRVDQKGIRHPIQILSMSFLSPGVEVQIPEVEAYAWEGRNFTWLNSSQNPTQHS